MLCCCCIGWRHNGAFNLLAIPTESRRVVAPVVRVCRLEFWNLFSPFLGCRRLFSPFFFFFGCCWWPHADTHKITTQNPCVCAIGKVKKWRGVQVSMRIVVKRKKKIKLLVGMRELVLYNIHPGVLASLLDIGAGPLLLMTFYTFVLFLSAIYIHTEFKCHGGFSFFFFFLVHTMVILSDVFL